jgi:hypothetical protein
LRISSAWLSSTAATIVGAGYERVRQAFEGIRRCRLSRRCLQNRQDSRIRLRAKRGGRIRLLIGVFSDARLFEELCPNQRRCFGLDLVDRAPLLVAWLFERCASLAVASRSSQSCPGRFEPSTFATLVSTAARDARFTVAEAR